MPNIRLVAGYLGERFAKHSASGKGLGILQQYTAPARGEDWGYFTSIDAMFDAAAQSGPNAISQTVNRGMLGDLVHGYPNIMAVGIALASDTVGSARPTDAYDQWIGAQAVANFANNPKWRVAPLFVRT